MTDEVVAREGESFEITYRATGMVATAATEWTSMAPAVEADAWRRSIGRTIRVTDPYGEIAGARVLAVDGEDVRLRVFVSPDVLRRGLTRSMIEGLVRSAVGGMVAR